MDNYELLKERMDNYCKVFESSLEPRKGIFEEKLLDRGVTTESLEMLGIKRSGLDKVKDTELYGIFRVRAKNLGLEISDTAIIYLGYFCGLFDAPGDIVMYLCYLAWKAWEDQKNEKSPIQLTIGEIAEILDHKALSPAKMDEVWLAQKGAEAVSQATGWICFLSRR